MQCYVEKLAEEPEEAVKKPVVVANVNKWEGEDEDDVKVSFRHTYFDWCLFIRLLLFRFVCDRI